jgi:hypothetical protein
MWGSKGWDRVLNEEGAIRECASSSEGNVFGEEMCASDATAGERGRMKERDE